MSAVVLETRNALHVKQASSVLVARVNVRHAHQVNFALLDPLPHDRAPKEVSVVTSPRFRGVSSFGVPRKFHVRPVHTAHVSPQLQRIVRRVRCARCQLRPSLR